MNYFIFRKRGAFFNLVKSESYQWHRDDHRELLRGMTMTVCDLAAITKPWHIEKRVSIAIYIEFRSLTRSNIDDFYFIFI